MCGIAGSWTRDGSENEAQRLRASLDAIRHRGPDDLGVFSWTSPRSRGRVDLGLARLAIQDLSHAGHQPMSDPTGRFTVTFNGEITNFVEIRNELIAAGNHFASGSDTEVLVRAWATWGPGTLDRLEGMWAFAILDNEAETLTLVRDPFGIKPLFYAITPGRVVFNSELQGLLAYGVTSRTLDWQVAVDYLQWGAYDHTEHTFIDGVRQLRPGHYLVVDTTTGATSAPQPYWKPAVATRADLTYDDAVDTVRTLLVDSVKRNLRSDVRLGIALSGGIDSSAIAAIARRLEPDAPLHTFSFVSPGYARSEHEWVALVAAHVGAESHRVSPDQGDLARDIDDLIVSQGEPFGSTSIYAQSRVFKLAREQGVTVTLDGQGGDEIFAGYSGYPAQRMHSLLETGHVLSAAAFTRQWGTWPDRSRLAMLAESAAQFAPLTVRHRVRRPRLSPLLDASALRDRDVRTAFPPVGVDGVRGARLKSHLVGALTRYGLPALLRHGDRNSMRYSIESRVPFLDRALAEFVLGLPEPWLSGPDGTSKRILRDAVSPWLPAEVIARRDKVGFETPEEDWLGALGNRPLDDDHPIGFLRPGRTATLTAGLTERDLRWGHRGYWRLINLRRWVSLLDIDAT